MTDVAERASRSRMPENTSQRILPLSAEAIAQIHSSKHITSLQGVVFALLENSLDAGATRVDISVDWRLGGCTVDDNGLGISTAEFAEDGGLGKLYCTSKRSAEGPQTNDFHGSNGTFLAELAAMSLLSLTSTHAHRPNAAILTWHHGKVIARRLPDPATPGLVTTRQQSGTSVTVRDLFGNMPVRIKQRALAGEASSDVERSWHELKRGVVALLLAWPEPCSVKLRDTSATSKILTISGHNASVSEALTMKSLNQLSGKAARFDLRDALPILFQSGFAHPESRSKWIPLSASTSAVSLKGLICLDPAPTKQCQFLALGVTPCSTTSGHNELYDVVTKVFSNSSFGIVEESASMRASEKATDGYTGKQLQAKKGVDRFPMYYIQLKIKDRSCSSAHDLEMLNDSSLKAIIDVLEAAVTTWLESNHMRPRKRKRRRNQEQDAPTGLPAPSSRPPSAGTLSARDETPKRIQPLSGREKVERIARDTGKRQRIIDLSERAVSRSNESTLNAAVEAGELSKIRFGKVKDRPQSALQRSLVPPIEAELQSPRPATSATSSNIRATMPITKRRTLRAEGIEAGELGGHRGKKQALGKPHVGEDASSDDFGTIDDDDLLGAEQDVERVHVEQHGVDSEDHTTIWTDPVSKQIFRVNSRTGVVLPLSTETPIIGPIPTRQRAAIDTALSSNGKPLSLARRSALSKKDAVTTSDSIKDQWLPGFLKQWNNPVFAAQKEEPIPVASLNGPGPLDFDTNSKCCSHEHFESRLDNNSGGTKLTKTGLKEAEVVAQVDTKFILCKMPAAASQKAKSTLVLIDQHAASERVMLEKLLEELCTPPKHTLTSIQTISLRNETARAQPLVVEVSAREIEMFARYRTHFARWGILYDLPGLGDPESLPKTDERRQSKIRVTHLPTPVAERCANFPALAIEMLRSEIWALEEGSRKVDTNTKMLVDEVEVIDQPRWLSLLSSIPPSLLALLHSRSCRSAIMFNDVLSQGQCTTLVKDLGKCVFPFVCAHGRISMVPLGDLGMPGEVQEGGDRGAMGVWLKSRRGLEAQSVGKQ